VGRHAPTLPFASGRREEARTSGGNHEALSTVAGHAFGPAHSSGEAPVMGVERRCRTVLVSSFGQPNIFGRDRVSESKSKEEAKPFRISKREVWEVYQKVKANGGASGWTAVHSMSSTRI
jgi:hypothetical protein